MAIHSRTEHRMRSMVRSSVSLEALGGKLKVLAAREGSVFGGIDGDRQCNRGRLFFDVAVRFALFHCTQRQFTTRAW